MSLPSHLPTQLFESDEVKINPDLMHNLHFGSIERIKSVYRKRGIIIETDFNKKKNEWSYFVEFQNSFQHRYWFLNEELILV